MEHLPLKACNEVARTGHTLCDHRQPLRSCGVCRQKNVGISAEQRRMSELRSVGGRMITFAAALVLSFSVVTASKEGSRAAPQLTDCTEHGVSLCYTQYAMIFYTLELQKNHGQEFFDNIFNKTCSAFDETSSCYAGFARCPHFMRNNFTRREEGYRTFRSVMCNKEYFKAVTTAKACTEFPKMYACTAKQLGPSNTNHAEYEELLCRYNPAQSVCYEKSWKLSCPMSLESTLAAVARVTDAAELLHDCKRMYRQDFERDDNGVAVGSTSNAAAIGDLGSEVAEIRALLRDTSKVVFSLSEDVNAMQEEIEYQRTENAKIFKALKTSIEFLEGLIQAERK